MTQSMCKWCSVSTLVQGLTSYLQSTICHTALSGIIWVTNLGWWYQTFRIAGIAFTWTAFHESVIALGGLARTWIDMGVYKIKPSLWYHVMVKQRNTSGFIDLPFWPISIQLAPPKWELPQGTHHSVLQHRGVLPDDSKGGDGVVKWIGASLLKVGSVQSVAQWIHIIIYNWSYYIVLYSVHVDRITLK